MEQWQEILEACPLFDGIGIRELGAMIDDIQTMGDYAIEKWKEEDQNND